MENVVNKEQNENDIIKDDITIAEEANAEIQKWKKKAEDAEKELAREKLYKRVDTPEQPEFDENKAWENFFNPNSCSYDIFKNALDIYDNNKAKGVEDSDEYTPEVMEFVRDVLSSCEGDKTKFHSVYQAKLGKDTREAELAYTKAIKHIK